MNWGYEGDGDDAYYDVSSTIWMIDRLQEYYNTRIKMITNLRQ